MSKIHIYRASEQEATKFFTDLGGPILHCSRCSGKAVKYADCCKRMRWAGNLTVQVYYDLLRFRCKPGKGCQ